MSATPRPPVLHERHVSIDAVRGLAVLGILLMNIVAMGLPSFAYVDPTYAGGSTGADLWTWSVNNVLIDGKMRALFSMLFGASAVLIAERAEGATPGPAQTHYRRMFWLFVFGMLHAYLLFFGDILVCYAIAGALVFPMRKLDPRRQIGVGAAVLLALLAHNVLYAEHLESLRAAAAAPGASASAVEAWREASAALTAPPGLKAQELAGFGGGFADALEARARMAALMQLVVLPSEALPEAVGQMLVGMGLFRLGFFTLGWPTRAYVAVIAFGYLVAAPMTAWLAWEIRQSGFHPLDLHRWEAWQQAPRPFIALAHASVLLLMVRARGAQASVSRLAAAGRMALSNYLLTSVVAVLVFNGFGLGLYGKLSRFELLSVVVGIWCLIIIWSAPWLARFNYGPFEWAWRSLVRWSPQPFAKPRSGAQRAEA